MGKSSTVLAVGTKPVKFSLRVAMGYTPRKAAHLPQSLKRPTQLERPKELPFFKLPSHTIPTKWSLYRPLLRATRPQAQGQVQSQTSSESQDESQSRDQSEDGDRTGLDHPAIRRMVRERWKKMRLRTSETTARMFLQQQYELLDTLTSSSPKDRQLIQDMEAGVKRRQGAKDKVQADKAAARAARAAVKPMLVGGYIYPSLYNPPLPRLKPQPLHWTMMILRRKQVRQRTILAERQYKAWVDDMSHERRFWQRCGIPLAKEDAADGRWDSAYFEMRKITTAKYEKDLARSQMVFSEEIVDKVEKARKGRKLSWARKAQKVKAERNARMMEAEKNRRANVVRRNKIKQKRDLQRKLEEARRQIQT